MVNGLELQDWQPARFRCAPVPAAPEVSRKISQKAVQNISALGGAGATAAIQHSYRFFENFGYERIGWSCGAAQRRYARWAAWATAMAGLTPSSRSGSIPAITVMGYNREVSWGELITRLKRVTRAYAGCRQMERQS